ncbi:MAG: hypothetical protein ACNI27_04155 [Desulfovibrio sp.]
MLKKNFAPKSPFSSSGFTFMEVMVALIFVAVALVMFLQSTSFYQNSIAASGWKEKALRSGSNKMTELILEGVSSSTVKSGNLSPTHPELKWKAKTELTDVDSLYRFELLVFEEAPKAKDRKEVILEYLFTE